VREFLPAQEKVWEKGGWGGGSAVAPSFITKMNIAILELISLVGLVNILTRSAILQSLRDSLPTDGLRYGAQCPMCVGFWVGVLYFCLTTASFGWPCLVSLFLYGGLVSICSSFAIHTLDAIPFVRAYFIAKTNVLYPPGVPEQETE